MSLSTTANSLALAMTIALTCGVGDVEAFEFITGQGTGLGESVILSRSSASALVSVPSGGITRDELKLELGVNRKFELKDLDQGFVAVAYRRSPLTYSLGLSQFGHRDLYSEQTVKAGVSWHTDSLTIGTTLSVMAVYFGQDYETLSAITLGGGISYRTRRLMGAITVDNITSPQLEKGSPAINPKYSGHVEILDRRSYSITGRVTLEKTERPQFALGQKIDLSKYGALFWGLSTAPFQYGGGLEIGFKKGRISYAVSYHPTLGFTHTGSLSFDFALSAPSTGTQP
ncbi:MAG: hypothetical protein ACE5K8_01725 [Candidatus Zixiibacteriota bacterium]